MAEVTGGRCPCSMAGPVLSRPNSRPGLQEAWEGISALNSIACFLCFPPSPQAAGLQTQPSRPRKSIPTLQVGLCFHLWPWLLLRPHDLIQSRGPNFSTQVAKTKVRKNPEDTLLEVSTSSQRKKEPGAPSSGSRQLPALHWPGQGPRNSQSGH